MRTFLDEEALVIEKGDGVYLYDTDGKRYIDGVSSLWVNIHGHRVAAIDEAIKIQLEKIAHSTMLGLSNVPAALLAKTLVEISPAGLEKVFFSDNGSTACEIALKMAFQYWRNREGPGTKRTKFISLEHAYHGDTIGSVSVGGIDTFHRIFQPLLFHSIKAPSPHPYRFEGASTPEACKAVCLARLETILKEHAEETAALIMEPLVQGAAGIIVHPEGFYRAVRELCTTYGILMIADEVAVGFGRTGAMFASDVEGVRPDLMALAKGITGGYLPLAATLATQEIFAAFAEDHDAQKTFFHGHSYTGNPLAAAAALANIKLFRTDRVLDRLAPKTALLKERLAPFKELPHVGDVRQKGFIAGIELVQDRETDAPYPPEEKRGVEVIKRARAKGLIIRPLGDVIVVMPPLSIEPDTLVKMLDIIYESIRDVTE